jgi:cobalamin biosynthesis protein CobD/CbiB
MANDELVKGGELLSLTRKLDEQMKNVYEEALKKNKEVYMGSIPTWGWILFLLVAFDDILVWLKSPYLAIPITLVLVAVVLLYLFGGKSTMNNITNTIRQGASNVVSNLTTQAASSMLKR